ncbi:MAG: hypothetical protein ABIH23_11205 [bacterium]
MTPSEILSLSGREMALEVQKALTMPDSGRFYAVRISHTPRLWLDAAKALEEYLPSETKLPCGNIFQLNSLDELTGHDVPCPCGNPNHWFVKYEAMGEPLEGAEG